MTGISEMLYAKDKSTFREYQYMIIHYGTFLYSYIMRGMAKKP